MTALFCQSAMCTIFKYVMTAYNTKTAQAMFFTRRTRPCSFVVFYKYSRYEEICQLVIVIVNVTKRDKVFKIIKDFRDCNFSGIIFISDEIRCFIISIR